MARESEAAFHATYIRGCAPIKGATSPGPQNISKCGRSLPIIILCLAAPVDALGLQKRSGISTMLIFAQCIPAARL